MSVIVNENNQILLAYEILYKIADSFVAALMERISSSYLVHGNEEVLNEDSTFSYIRNRLDT